MSIKSKDMSSQHDIDQGLDQSYAPMLTLNDSGDDQQASFRYSLNADLPEIRIVSPTNSSSVINSNKHSSNPSAKKVHSAN